MNYRWRDFKEYRIDIILFPVVFEDEVWDWSQAIYYLNV